VARSYPIYQHSPFALHTVAFIGAIGTIYAASMGLANNDIKRVLAYSTMSQIAYMFVGVGVAYYASGILHLLEHAFFKALLFMGAGAVMHALHDELDIQKMGGLRRKLPYTYWTFLVGVLAIIGTPFFSGFSSKEDVLGGAFARASHGDGWLWIVWVFGVIAAGLTAAYMFRLLFLVFHGQPRDTALQEHAHDPDITMRAPMGILAFLSFAGFFIAIPGAPNYMEQWLSPVFHRFNAGGPVIGSVPFSPISLIVTLAVTFVGFLIALQIYFRHNPTPERVGAAAPFVYNLLYHKYYVDELYDLMFVRPVKWLGAMVYRFVDQDFIDGIVNGSASLTGLGSRLLRQIQTGYARNYALYILFGAMLVVGYYVVGGR
jgi:NADH-quinone oxidoreductase subunit L